MFIPKKFTNKILVILKKKYFKKIKSNFFLKLNSSLYFVFPGYSNFFYNYNQLLLNFILLKKKLAKKSFYINYKFKKKKKKKKIFLKLKLVNKNYKIFIINKNYAKNSNKSDKLVKYNENFKLKGKKNMPFYFKKYLKNQKSKLMLKKKLNKKKIKAKKLINKIFRIKKKKIKTNVKKKIIRKYDLIMGLLISSIHSSRDEFQTIKYSENLKFFYNNSYLDYYTKNPVFNLYKIFYKNKKNFLSLKKYFLKKKKNLNYRFVRGISEVHHSQLYVKKISDLKDYGYWLSYWFYSINSIRVTTQFFFKYTVKYLYYKLNLNTLKISERINTTLINNYVFKKINKDYDYKFNFNKLNVKKYNKKRGFTKYYKINTKINKKHLNMLNNDLFFVNYTISNINSLNNKKKLLKKDYSISKIKKFYQFFFLIKYVHINLNKYWLVKNTKQTNKIYLMNIHYKKKINLLNKLLLIRMDTKKNTNKISKEYNFKYKLYNNKNFNKYIKLKYLFFPIPENTFININKELNLSKNVKKQHIIFDYMYITQSTVQHYFIKFFKYSKFLDKNSEKLIVNDKEKTFFFNCWQGLLISWKNARQIHWNIYNKGKTLKKKRYRKFLPPFLKKNKIVKDLIISHFTFKFNFSNIFWNIFTKLYLYFYNKNIITKEIFQIPINYLFWIFLVNLKKDKLKIKKKINSWLETNSKVRKTFWMSVKKKIPKFFSKQIYKIENYKNVIQYDYITNYFCIIKEKKNYVTLNDYIFSNKLLKLHNFRYKS